MTLDPTCLRECIESRYPEGYILCVDWKSMEVRGGAALSNCTTLLKELNANEDPHINNASDMYKIPQTEVSSAQRTFAKRRSFELQYGAGVATMARNTAGKNSIDEVKKFKLMYENKYPQLKLRADYIKDKCRIEDRPGVTQKYHFKNKVAKYSTPSGRILTFKFYDQDPLPWNKLGSSPKHELSRTELMNWESQSFATADISAIMLVKLLNYLQKNHHDSNFEVILTQYDSIYFDCESENLAKELGEICVKFLNKTKTIIEKEFNIKDLGVEFPAEYTIKKHL